MRGETYQFTLNLRDDLDQVKIPVKIYVTTEADKLEALQNKTQVLVNTTLDKNETSNATTLDDGISDAAKLEAQWFDFLNSFYGSLNGAKSLSAAQLNELKKLPFVVPYVSDVDRFGEVEISFSRKCIPPTPEVLK